MSDELAGTGKRPREAWLRALERTAPIDRHPAITLPVVVEQVAAAFPNKPALIGEKSSLTYRELTGMARRYAGWAMRQGIGGGIVCLMMPNCPEYLAIWLGITRAGGTVALLDPHLAGESLIHAIDTVRPSRLIAAATLVEAVDAVSPHLGSKVQIWVHGDGHPRHPRIEAEIEAAASAVLDGPGSPAPTLADRALCIYTSGTTGRPKAATVSHYRLMQWSHWFAGMMDASDSDRMYNCLPMYHSIGGVAAPGAMLVSGGSVVLRERFSASRFWDDVVASECTVFQYIGELCRYLVNNPAHPRETAHRLRLCCGNGLRADIWNRFSQRFCIPQILEFYAATEANFSLYNCEGEPGSIGRIPGFLSHRFRVALVKLDIETGEPLRGNDGFCVRCGPDEHGEAIAKIGDERANPGGGFEGYTDPQDSETRILRDVSAPGDAWFRSGDLMRRDTRGFLYFVDRLGDTFRWKGENVSTTQVAEVVAGCPGVRDAVVYGVTVPAAEGRAGMAAVAVNAGFDLAMLQRRLDANLPEHARPLFVRVCDAIETTATFKYKRLQLAREGYDPRLTDDPLYFKESRFGVYVPLTPALYEAIANASTGP